MINHNKKNNQFIYIGDCGADIVENEIMPGGCALNTTYHLHQIGEKADVITWIGDDSQAQHALNYLKYLQVNPTGIHTLRGKTPGQTIGITPTGEKRFVNYEEGVLAKAYLTDQDKKLINKHQVLITLYYTQIEHLFKEVTSLKFDGIKVIDFMNGEDFNFDIEFIKKYEPWFDIAFFGLAESDEKFINQLAQLSKSSSKMFVITLGEKGSKVFWQGKVCAQQAQPIDKVIDTTGAGDAYIAGFLSVFLKTNDVDKTMLAGSRQALETLKIKGAIPQLESIV